MKKVKDLKTYYFECSCHTQEHTFGMAFDVDNKEVMMFNQLTAGVGFFGRIKNALKYILKMDVPTGQWEETLLNEEKFVELYNIMTRFAFTAGIKDKSAKKIQAALGEVNKGNPNSMVTGSHRLGDITNTLKKK